MTTKLPSKITYLANIIRTISLSAVMTTGLTMTAFAESIPSTQTANYHITADDLGHVLATFATQSGVVLAFDTELTKGLKSKGLKGKYSITEGFEQLLKGTNLQLVKRTDGSLTLQRISNQTQPVQARDLGQLRTIDVNAASSANLDPNAVQLPVITVNANDSNSYTIKNTSTATGLNLSLRETPQSITVITRQRMDDQNLQSITNVLNQTPGVTMSQDGGERYNIYSRGSAINTYQIDGVTTSQENITRNMPSTLLDMALYEQVEVVRGATGLMTGAGEPSGVVNLTRKRPTHELQSYVQANIGSWDSYRAEADVSGPLTDSGNIRGRLVAAKQNNKSFMDWYGQEKDILYGVIETDITESTLLRFGIDYQKYKSNGAPGVPLLFTNGNQTNFSRSTSSGAEWMYDNFETTNYIFALEQKLGGTWKLNLNANYMNVDRDADLGWYRSTSGLSYLNEETGIASAERAKLTVNQVQRGINFNLQGTYDLFNQSHDLVLGYNYSDYENNHRSFTGGIATFNFYTWDHQLDRPISYTPSQVFDINSHQSGYYLANRFNFTDELHLIAGARLSNYKYDYRLTSLIANTNTPIKMNEKNELTPYFGLIYDITPNQSIYSSYTDIFKPQSSQDKNGNVLEPVVGKNYELGWKGEFYDGRLNTSAAIYQIQRDNLAEVDPGETTPSNTQAYRAVDGAETKGFDLEISGEILPRWNVQAGYSHSRTEDATGNRLTTQLPMDTFQFWNTYQFTGDLEKLMIGGGINWNSSKSLTFSRYNATIKDGDYIIANLMAQYKVNDHLTTALNFNNIFNEKYYSGIAGSYGHYGAPRNFMATVKYKF